MHNINKKTMEPMGTCSKWLKVIKFEPKKERPQWLNEGKQKWQKQI